MHKNDAMLCHWDLSNISEPMNIISLVVPPLPGNIAMVNSKPAPMCVSCLAFGPDNAKDGSKTILAGTEAGKLFYFPLAASSGSISIWNGFIKYLCWKPITTFSGSRIINNIHAIGHWTLAF